MSEKEVKEFLKLIQTHYQHFKVDETLIKIWYEELKKYDKEDVYKKFDQYLRNEEFNDSIPKLYYLTKYLKTKEEKLKSQEHYIGCEICGQAVNLNDFQQHHDRCLSIEYVNKLRLKYFGKEVNKEQLRKLDEDKFIELYEKMLNIVLEKTNDPIEKKRIENYFFSKKGIVEFNPELYLINSKI